MYNYDILLLKGRYLPREVTLKTTAGTVFSLKRKEIEFI